MSTPNTTRLGNTAHYYVTTDIHYAHPPSVACAAARNQLKSIAGLTAAGYDVLFGMMIETEGMIRAGFDQWIGFSAASFSRERLPDVRQLVNDGLLIRQIPFSDDGPATTVVYFFSPGVVA